MPVGERNACVPTALSFIKSIPFNKVNNWLIRNGHRNEGTGTTVSSWLYEFGFVPILFKIDEMTILEFAKNYDKPDTWFVLLDGHAAIVDKGEIYDVIDSSNLIVRHAWCKVNDKLPIDLL